MEPVDNKENIPDENLRDNKSVGDKYTPQDSKLQEAAIPALSAMEFDEVQIQQPLSAERKEEKSSTSSVAIPTLMQKPIQDKKKVAEAYIRMIANCQKLDSLKSLSFDVLDQAYQKALSADFKPNEVRMIRISKGEDEDAFLAKIDKLGMVKLLYMGDELGEGGFGTIYEVINIGKGTEKAVKFAHGDVDLERAIKDLHNEYDKLWYLHNDSKDPIWGIQDVPGRIIHIVLNEEGNEDLFGLMGKKYEKNYLDDLSENPNLSFEDRLFEFHQLLFGLKHLSDKGILHGDLKPPNILIKHDEHGNKLVHIADLGGSRDTKNPEELTIGTRSKLYSLEQDLEKSKLFLATNMSKEFIENEEKRDIFAMGSILYVALHTKLPYTIGKNDFPDISIKPSFSESIDPKMKSLILDMIQENPLQRPSSAEAFARLDSHIKENYPAVYSRILLAMQNK